MDALIGHSGFVGSTLLRQRSFDAMFRSTDIAEISHRSFDTVICAGVPAQKWIAERDPAADLDNIKKLAALLDTIKASRFVLISTVDVFADSRGATEQTPVKPENLSAYGANRHWLETFVAGKFSSHQIVRLTGLVGPGLRKNAIFDLRNNNNLHLIDARGVYQFYPMVNLWSDIEAARRAGLSVVHLAPEPLSVAEVAREGFGIDFQNYIEGRTPASYDLQTSHAEVLGGQGGYLYSKRECLMAIRAYAQSEPHSAPMA